MQLQSNETVYIPRVGVKRGTCKPVRSYLGQGVMQTLILFLWIGE